MSQRERHRPDTEKSGTASRKKRQPKPYKPKGVLDGLRDFYLLFSIAWCAGLLAYAIGYSNVWREAGLSALRAENFGQILVFLSLIFVPLIALWGPYFILRKYAPSPFAGDMTQTGDGDYIALMSNEVLVLKRLVSDLQKSQDEMRTELLSAMASSPQSPTKPNRKHLDDADPALPLDESRADRDVDLKDMAHVLNFADQKQKGDWANAFAQISQDGDYLGFVQLAEAVLEVFEQEGIYVEDISLRPASPEVWRKYVKGERGDNVASLSGVRDPSVLAIIRARLRNDANFQDMALRYQKRFIKMLEALSEDASADDFVALNRARGGRVFVILGQISGLFT